MAIGDRRTTACDVRRAFVVDGGLEKVAITPDVSARIGHQQLDNTAILAGVAALLFQRRLAHAETLLRRVPVTIEINNVVHLSSEPH